MIGRLRGVLADKQPGEILIDVGGVGFSAMVSLTTFCALPEAGEKVELVTVTNAREHAIELFAFGDSRERELFQLLRSVSGIGPRLALTILSGMAVDDLIDVLRNKDVGRLVSVPGVGKKTAERVLVELSEKVAELAADSRDDSGEPARPSSTRVENDAVLALLGLGYKERDARRAVEASRDGDDESPQKLETLIKRSLAYLS